MKALNKESFWTEHQDTLVKIREDLASRKGVGRYSKPKNGALRKNSHPPLGKYRRTPSPYLPKLGPQKENKRPDPTKTNLRGKAFEKVPPVKPKLAFSKKVEEYDSWGEESDDNFQTDESDDNDDDDDDPLLVAKNRKGKKRFKPQPYPSPMLGMPQQFPMFGGYGGPFSLYYPPPPQGGRHRRKSKPNRNKGYKDIYNNRRVQQSYSGIPVAKRNSRKPETMYQSVPVYPGPFPFMTTVPFVYPMVLEEEDEIDSSDDAVRSAFLHMRKHPLFAEDVASWFIQDCLDTDLLPDCLIEILDEMKHMPYDHPLYLPTLYACEDFLSDQLSEMVVDLVREAVDEVKTDLIDEERLKRDPLDDFLNDLIDDAVRQSTRELVRSTVVNMAEEYMETQVASGIIDSMVDDFVFDLMPELTEEVLFESAAEEFISEEVIRPEVFEEAELIARETIQHYDTKIMRRELKEVTGKARDQLADRILMDYLLTVMSQRGKLWTQNDYYNRHLDDTILNISLGQMDIMTKQRNKTLLSKPLHKLHERVVSDVGMDVFLQQLTKTLDEDMADIDEYERGVNHGISATFPRR